MIVCQYNTRLGRNKTTQSPLFGSLLPFWDIFVYAHLTSVFQE